MQDVAIAPPIILRYAPQERTFRHLLPSLHPILSRSTLNNFLVMSTETSTSSRSWAMTNKKMIKHEFIWEISTINFHGDMHKQYLESPTYNVGVGVKKTCWYLRLYPAGDRDESKDYISLYLWRKPCEGGYALSVETWYSFVILNTKNEVIKKLANVHNTYPVHTAGNGYSKICEKGLWFEKPEKPSCNDKAKIVCQMTIILGTKHTFGEGQLPRALHQACVSHRGLGDLLKSRKLSDVTLVSDGEEFEAHRAILAAESPVFEAMFCNDTKEVREGRVEISDVHADVLEEMLRFIYVGNSSFGTTGKLNEGPRFALELLQAADKYQIDRLRTFCEDVVVENLCLESAVDSLRVAYLHNSRYLQDEVKKFMKKNSAELIAKMIAEGCLTKNELLRNTSSSDKSQIGPSEEEDAGVAELMDSS